ncbi:MAG: Tetratricopeptide repeat-containing protein, partial [Subtercola sp.]|nr:Tetratricopeptide repeat-containing protein [Subtercola sp.]
MDVARVVELYVPDLSGGGQIGSGYRLTDELVLTAAHVVTDLPTHPPDAPVPDDVHAAGVGQARPLGEQAWTAAAVAWRDNAADVAMLRQAAGAPPLPPGSPTPRWGRLEGGEPIAVSAVGFPWAQERPDRVRDTEHLFGFLAPATQLKAAQLAISVLSSAPAARDGGSPWAGMSGAALFTGPFLVGVLVVDPAGFAPDRVVAAPIAPLLADPTLARLLGEPPLTAVGPRPRLAITADTSIAVAPPYRAASGRLGREPSRLLLPEYGVVPFLGRDTELQTLEGWCLTGGGAALRLLLGAGGAGKTRLAAEACVRLAAHGWQAGLADPNVPGGHAELAFDRATLLVVDDADLNIPLLEELIRVLSYWPPDASPVRLLLVARHRTGWWDTLNQRTDHLADELADDRLVLRDGELTVTDRATHHTAALAAFTPHLQDPSPATRTSPDLEDAAFTNPLLVHMHALLAATGGQVSTTGTDVRERVLDAVLDRERRRWADTFPADVPTGGTRTHQKAVTVTTLLAPPTEQTTTALLTLLGDLSDAPTGARAAVTTWLHERHPGAEPPWVAPLRPDLLTEQLLATCPDLTDLVLTGYQQISGDVPGSGQVEQLLTELTRAAARVPVQQALGRLLADRLPDLLEAALAGPAGRLPDLLDRAIALCPQSQVAADLIDRLPEHSTGLAGLAATLTAQAVDHHRHLVDTDPEVHTIALAMSLNNLSNRLGDLGRREDALTAIEEAVTLRRALATARPDAFTPDLAMSLNNL